MAQVTTRAAIRRLIGAATFVILQAFVSAEAASPVRFSLDRRIDGSAAPFIVAQARGLFRAEGLDVAIDAANGSPEALDRVARGERDMALVDLNALIRFRDRTDAPKVQAVYVVHNRVGYAIVARKSRGITTLANLQGKTIGVADGDLAIATWPGLARRNGVDPSKVTLEKIGAAVREPMLSAGQVDSVSGNSYAAGHNVKDRGIPASDLTVLKFADLGSQLYGLAVVVNPDFATAHPEAVQGFLRATNAGIKFSIKEPVLAIDDTLALMEGATRDLELERLRLVLRDNIATEEVKSNGLGSVDPARFNSALDQIAEDFKFKNRPSLSAIFNDSFLPPLAERKLD